MKKYYLTYLFYILEHKKNFFKIAWKKGMYREAFTHDMSKFSRHEFKPYADWFYGEYGVKLKGKKLSEEEAIKHSEVKGAFDIAWKHHCRVNPHHWNFWLYDNSEYPLRMRTNYINEMICDWEAMAIKFNDTTEKYYLTNYFKIKLHPETRIILEENLDICPISNVTLEEFFSNKDKKWENGFILHIALELSERYGVNLVKIFKL